MKSKKRTVASQAEEVEKLEYIAGNKRYQAMPHLFFFIGLGSGLILNLFSNILHDLYKDSMIYKMVVIISTVVIVGYIFRWIRNFHLTPIKNAEDKVEDAKSKLKNMTRK